VLENVEKIVLLALIEVTILRLWHVCKRIRLQLWCDCKS